MNKYIIEFVGTFFLVLVIALTGNPIAVGGILTAMIYMGGYISGAHYNPAVTLAVFVRGKIEKMEALKYVGAQIAGGAVAAVVFDIVKGSAFVPAPAPEINFYTALLVEAIFTFALASVILHVATSAKTQNNQYFGLAIGLTVMAAAFAAGPISGGAFNPAVGIGPILVDVNNFPAHTSALLLYTAGPLIGGALAGLFYRNVTMSK